MTDFSALLDAYPTLSLAERAAADARLAPHPEWAEAHAEARRFAALVDAATGPVDADDLARLAVDRRMGRVPPDADAIDAARAADPALEAEAARIEARLQDLEAGAENPIEQFERLSGIALGAPSAPGGDGPPARPWALLDRPPARPRLRRLGRASHWAAAAAVVLVAYGGLFATSLALVPERARVAALGEVEAEAPPVLRSATLRGDAAAHTADLVEALEAVHDARRSVLGLFPSYDPAGLDAAADALASITEAAAPSSSASQEARLALGRVHLYRGRDAEAARVLGGLVQEGSYRASAARRLLDYIRQGA